MSELVTDQQTIESIINNWKNDSRIIPQTMMTGRSMNISKALLEVTEKAEISPEDCEEHDFQFYELMGTFCTKCHIPFGVECLHPDCKEHECEKHMLFYEAFSEENYGDVANQMTENTAFVHLGHDGVGCNCKADEEGLRRLLSFKNLKRLEYCDYYSHSYFYDIIEEDQYKHINFVGIL